MKNLQAIRSLVVAAALFALSAPLLAAIETSVVSSGLSDPIFVVHAGDGTGRLFTEEQGGDHSRAAARRSAPTVFLDISSNVLAGGERGLLGLAFHPPPATADSSFTTRDRTMARSSPGIPRVRDPNAPTP